MNNEKVKSTLSEKLANALFNHKKLLLGLLFLATLIMAIFASQLKVDAGFEKQLPLEHEYMQTFMEHAEFRGANRILLAMIDNSGDMFNEPFFNKFEQLTDDTYYITGVYRPSVKSIFTPNVRFVEVVEDGFAGGNVIPSDYVPGTEMFETIRANIVKAGIVGRLVAADFNGAMVWADLQEINPETGEKIDYQQVAAELEALRQKYESNGQTVHIIGFAKVIGDVAAGAKSVLYFFALAIFITMLLMFWYS